MAPTYGFVATSRLVADDASAGVSASTSPASPPMARLDERPSEQALSD